MFIIFFVIVINGVFINIDIDIDIVIVIVVEITKTNCLFLIDILNIFLEQYCKSLI